MIIYQKHVRRITAIGLFAILLLAAGPSDERKAVPLAPGDFFLQGDTVLRKPANCTWVVFKGYVLVIDANFPWGAREILSEIKRTTSKPIRFVFNTHYHAHHTFGNGVFMTDGAAIVCSRECGSEPRTQGAADWHNHALTRGQSTQAPHHDN